MQEKTLFKDFNPVIPKARKETCRSCKFRERHQKGNSVIQYCGVRSSNRTVNKQLKIKVTNPACEHWELEK